MVVDSSVPDYSWSHGRPHTEAYLLKPLLELLPSPDSTPVRVLDLGCGNGSLSSYLHTLGYHVIGVDPSQSGIDVASSNAPDVSFYLCPADPASLSALHLGSFDVVVSTEVVEHCYAPRHWASAAFSLLNRGGIFVCSTPYHGYLKNLLLALTGKFDQHFTALWDGGHIKFWSRKTLTLLLEESGFEMIRFRGAGRFPWMWKSMLIACRKP